MSDRDTPASPRGTEGSDDSGAAAGPVTYRERLSPSPGVWAALTLMAILLGLVAQRLGPAGGIVTFVVAWLVMAVLLNASTPTIEVSRQLFVAGGARIPPNLLGPAETLEPEPMRLAAGPELDARAYLLLRGWIKTGIRVPLNDPEDPTPYWLISTRRPAELAMALAQAGHRA
jgi:hypothetical protein